MSTVPVTGETGFLAAAGGCLAVVGLLAVWLRSTVRYQIGKSTFRILLAGIPVYRVPFDQIERIGKPRGNVRWWWPGYWGNTLRPGHRYLTIRRKSGFPRSLIITPERRYEFQTQLRLAVQKAGGAITSDPSGSGGTEESLS